VQSIEKAIAAGIAFRRRFAHRCRTVRAGRRRRSVGGRRR